ncbi:MAG: hypothetical protein ABIU87_13810 [Ornithinibacter sp.]
MLVTAALEHLFEQSRAALAATEIPDGDRAETVVRLLIDSSTDAPLVDLLGAW